MARKVRPVPPALSREAAQGLAMRLAAVPRGADESHPAFTALLEEWERARVPGNARPTVQAYHSRDGWLSGSVEGVTRAITEHVERAGGME